MKRVGQKFLVNNVLPQQLDLQTISLTGTDNPTQVGSLQLDLTFLALRVKQISVQIRLF